MVESVAFNLLILGNYTNIFLVYFGVTFVEVFKLRGSPVSGF